MILIKKLHVQNFKSLYNSQIESMGPVNLFYGFNNSGKSNIFKFLELVFTRKQISTHIDYKEELVNGREESVTESLLSPAPFYEGNIFNQPYLFSKNDREVPIVFVISVDISNEHFQLNDKLEFDGYLGTDLTQLEITGQITSQSISESALSVNKATLNGKVFYEFRDKVPYFFENNQSGLRRRDGEFILNLLNDLVTYIDTDRNFTTEFIKDGVTDFDSKNFKNWLFELNINSDKYEIFNELVEFIGNFEFSKDAKLRLTGNMTSFPFNKNAEISFSRFGKEVEVMLRNEDGRFPLKNYGTGIQQFFYILSKIYGSKSKIVIIEEIELNLSQVYQVELLKFLKTLMETKYDQLLISSHSPYLTQKGTDLINYIHFVTINTNGVSGTVIESHDDPKSLLDDATGESMFSLLFS